MSARNGHDVPKDQNVASLDEARRRAAAKAKAAKRAGRSWDFESVRRRIARRES